MNAKQYNYNRYQEFKKEYKTHDRKYYKEHPDKRAAMASVKCAIKSGKLIRQPCSNCGSIKAECHHMDYSKKLDIIWLCRKCHVRLHKKLLLMFNYGLGI